MTTNQIKELLQKPYDTQRDEWRDLFKEMFKRVEFFAQPTQLSDKEEVVLSGGQMGLVKLEDGKRIALFEIEVADKIRIAKNRVALREIAVKYIDQNLIHGALVFYFNKNQAEYRLSFMARQSELTEGGSVSTETPPKRFTYLLGGNEACTTAAQRIAELIAIHKSNSSSIKTIIEAFSVEKLSKDFFKGYRDKHYSGFIAFLTGENADGKRINEPHEYLKSVFQNDKKAARDFVKKLLGRLVFMHFLQKKGWLGCPAHRKEWLGGDPAFLQNFFAQCPDKKYFLSKYLNELFFNTLNNDRQKTNYIFTLTNTRVPYLNGGLFDRDKLRTEIIDFPAAYFEELLAFFEQYNFTIDENDPEEQEVGIDPEMLGHIFENLLEDNKDKGAFYTPKEIVQYMCQESLIQYLETHLTEGGLDEEIPDFVRNRKVAGALERKDAAQRVNRLLQEVKICDPAIGSGAFPIGLLQEIFKARLHIYPFLKTNQPFSPAKIKKEIIQNAIYGVDKDGGAVDIARLRFWLALVVDEDMPEPLPNLDFKIMQGDSLLESFEGIPLDKMVKSEKTQLGVRLVNPQIDIFGNVKNAQTEFFTHDTEGVDFQQLLDDYFEATNHSKIKLHQQIDKFVLDNIHYNLETYKDNLQIRLVTAQKKLTDKSKSLKNEAQRQKLLEGKDAQEVAKLKAAMNGVDAKFEHLKALQECAERPFFLWHTYFKDVFEKGGFDIVIGNPPYVQLQKMANSEKMYAQAGFETYSKSSDIYCLFYEKGIKLLREKGVLAYITSNSWMRTKYGESLRKFFREQTDPSVLINFEDTQLFGSATVETNILLTKRQKFTEKLSAVAVKSDMRHQSLVKYAQEKQVLLGNLDDNGWIIGDKNTLFIKKKIEENSTLLVDFDYKIMSGVKTGFNEAYFIDENTKQSFKEYLDSDLFVPILRGRDIGKYSVKSSGIYLINAHNGNSKYGIKAIDIPNYYPFVYAHFEKFKEHMMERPSQGKHWTNTPASFSFEYSKPKIIWGELSDKAKFTYDNSGVYVEATVFLMTGKNLKYVLSIFNSQLGEWYFNQISTTSGMGTNRWKKYKIEQFPIKDISKEAMRPFEVLVDYVLWLKANENLLINPKDKVMSRFFEDMIDGGVYELYFEESLKKYNKNVLIYLQEIPALPCVAADEEMLTHIRNIFNQCYQPENPLRQRLYYMSTIPEVRVILGIKQ